MVPSGRSRLVAPGMTARTCSFCVTNRKPHEQHITGSVLSSKGSYVHLGQHWQQVALLQHSICDAGKPESHGASTKLHEARTSTFEFWDLRCFGRTEAISQKEASDGPRASNKRVDQTPCQRGPPRKLSRCNARRNRNLASKAVA